MSAEEAAASIETQEDVGQPNLGIYKNPELIESVVVFDPIGGSSLKFQDLTKLYFAGLSQSVSYSTTGASTSANWSLEAGGPVLAKAGGNDPYMQLVCRSVDNPGGLAARDLQGAATNPIQFRFDGIPMVLPRDSYIEITLEVLYVGPTLNVTVTETKALLQSLVSAGWARTASGLIQLVQAVDVSATSFQSPDMTTQNFLEAVQTKDTEIVLHPDYYFNSYNTGGIPLTQQQQDSLTVVSSWDKWGRDYPTVPQDIGRLETNTRLPVTFRIPLAAISPVFKTDVLPLYLTNSTSINIQFQVQNPNIGFPLFNVLGGKMDGVPKLSKSGWLSKSNTWFTQNYSNILNDPNAEIISIVNTKGSWTDVEGFTVWNPSGVAGQGVRPIDGGMQPVGVNQAYSFYSIPSLVNTATLASSLAVQDREGWGGVAVATTFPIVDKKGFLQYLFWAPEFSVKAYIKTYASVYQNPLAERYLRPYMVGTEGANFFRSSFLSYNFNSSTITVPPGASMNFAFNISQTLLNVPMAFLMFSEISYVLAHDTSYVTPSSTVTSATGVFSTSPATSAVGPITTVANEKTTLNQVLNSVIKAGSNYDLEYEKHATARYGLLDVFHRSQYYISPELDIKGVQVQIGPSGWNLYQRPLDIIAMNAITLNTLTRYDSEMCWSERLKHPQRFHEGDAFACFDLSHDLFRGLFIDSDNMLNITGLLINKSEYPKTVYLQCVLPYIDHFVIALADATVSKSQL